MVVVYRGDNAYFGCYYVGAVKSSADTRFYNRIIDLLLTEIQKADGGKYLKLGKAVYTALLHSLFHLLTQMCKGVAGNILIIELYSFFYTGYVGGGEFSHSLTRFYKGVAYIFTGTALAVCSGYMHGFKILMRLAEKSHKNNKACKIFHRLA